MCYTDVSFHVKRLKSLVQVHEYSYIRFECWIQKPVIAPIVEVSIATLIFLYSIHKRDVVN